MRSDSASLLRMILNAQTEAALLGHESAANRLEAAAQLVAGEIRDHSRTVLSDDIFRVVELLAMKKEEKKKVSP